MKKIALTMIMLLLSASAYAGTLVPGTVYQVDFCLYCKPKIKLEPVKVVFDMDNEHGYLVFAKWMQPSQVPGEKYLNYHQSNLAYLDKLKIDVKRLTKDKRLDVHLDYTGLTKEFEENIHGIRASDIIDAIGHALLYTYALNINGGINKVVLHVKGLEMYGVKNTLEYEYDKIDPRFEIKGFKPRKDERY